MPRNKADQDQDLNQVPEVSLTEEDLLKDADQKTLESLVSRLTGEAPIDTPIEPVTSADIIANAVMATPTTPAPPPIPANPVQERALKEPLRNEHREHRDRARAQIEVMRASADERRIAVENRIRELDEELIDILQEIRMYDYAIASYDGNLK